jgi:FeS assembly protein IscX
MDWENYTEIAEKLNELYPNTSIDSNSLSNDELIKMIVSLPDFVGDKNATDADFHRKFIRSRWISVRMPETFYVNDSAYL